MPARGDAEHNAAVIRRVFAGEPGPVADAVALNVAVGLMAYNRTEGCRVGDGTPSERLRRGVEVARETIASGKAQALLEKWASFTRES
nr:hypothetical protein [Nanchangia anserum]